MGIYYSYDGCQVCGLKVWIVMSSSGAIEWFERNEVFGWGKVFFFKFIYFTGFLYTARMYHNEYSPEK